MFCWLFNSCRHDWKFFINFSFLFSYKHDFVKAYWAFTITDSNKNETLLTVNTYNCCFFKNQVLNLLQMYFFMIIGIVSDCFKLWRLWKSYFCLFFDFYHAVRYHKMVWRRMCVQLSIMQIRVSQQQ